MKGFRVFLVDDEPATVSVITQMLTELRCRVVCTAGSEAEALKKIPTLKDLRVNLALIDGLAAGGRCGGKVITEKIWEQRPDIKVVSISALGLNFGDYMLPKVFNLQQLEVLLKKIK